MNDTAAGYALLHKLIEINNSIICRRNYLQKRRMKRRQLIKNLVLLLSAEKHVRRSIWTLDRTSQFWEIEVPKFTDERFKKEFRVSKDTFKSLVTKLSCLDAQNTNMRKCIPLSKRIAVALYSLGSPAEYQTIANLFGIGRTTTGEIILDFCSAVIKTLQRDFLSFFPPTAAQLTESIAGFEAMGFPQCIGAIGSYHIEVCPKQEEAIDYYNYKGWYSVVILAVCDDRHRFRYINVGFPGKYNDEYIFKHSQLKAQLKENNIYREMSKSIQGVKVPVMLLGDSAFSLSNIIMKPYPYKPNQSPLEKEFNHRLSKCHLVIENTFREYKARFRRLLKGLKVNIKNANKIIEACCILHNFCKENCDVVPDNDEINSLRPQPTFEAIEYDSLRPNIIRNAIAKSFEERRGVIGVGEDDEALEDEDDASNETNDADSHSFTFS